jgi:hypothetical protein
VFAGWESNSSIDGDRCDFVEEILLFVFGNIPEDGFLSLGAAEEYGELSSLLDETSSSDFL